MSPLLIVGLRNHPDMRNEMDQAVPEFEFAADAWDWLDIQGYFMTADRLTNVDGKEVHLFDFERSDGCKARLYLPSGELEKAEVRVI